MRCLCAHSDCVVGAHMQRARCCFAGQLRTFMGPAALAFGAMHALRRWLADMPRALLALPDALQLAVQAYMPAEPAGSCGMCPQWQWQIPACLPHALYACIHSGHAPACPGPSQCKWRTQHALRCCSARGLPPCSCTREQQHLCVHAWACQWRPLRPATPPHAMALAIYA